MSKNIDAHKILVQGDNGKTRFFFKSKWLFSILYEVKAYPAKYFRWMAKGYIPRPHFTIPANFGEDKKVYLYAEEHMVLMYTWIKETYRVKKGCKRKFLIPSLAELEWFWKKWEETDIKICEELGYDPKEVSTYKDTKERYLAVIAERHLRKIKKA